MEFLEKSTFSPDGEKSSISYGLLVFWAPKWRKSQISQISSNFQEISNNLVKKQFLRPGLKTSAIP